MKRGKEITLDLPYRYNVVSGTVDNKNPKSIYIQISAWGELKNMSHDDYESVLQNKRKRVKRKLFETLTDDKFYKDRSIVEFTMASSGISETKRSYMSVEMTLFQKEPLYPVNSKQLIPSLTNISEKIITGVFEKDEDFTFYKKKN